MVQRRMLQKVDQPSSRSAPRIRATKNDPSNANMDESSRAHDAWLFRDIEVAFVQAPVAHRRFRLRQRQHFGVSGRIFQHFYLVISTRDNPAIPRHDRADRHLFRQVRFVRQAQGFTHEIFIARQIFEVRHELYCFRLDVYVVHPMNKLFVSAAALLAFIAISSAHATEQQTVDHCARIIRNFQGMPEANIPRHVLRHAKGLAIVTVIKAGFIFSGKAGHGVVVARTGHGWSGPSFVGTGGAGWGLQAGAEATDFVFVLNTDAAVRAFAKGGNVTLGADASVAAGPVGRDAHVGVTPVAAIYTYSRTKGLFAGAAVEGAVIGTQKDENARYYGRPVSARDILHGLVRPPRGASVLRAALERKLSSGVGLYFLYKQGAFSAACA